MSALQIHAVLEERVLMELLDTHACVLREGQETDAWTVCFLYSRTYVITINVNTEICKAYCCEVLSVVC